MKTTQKYEDEINFDIQEISKEKNIELLKDFSDNLCKGLTEVEQMIIDILYKSKEAITSNKIRNIFTESYLIAISNYFLHNSDRLGNNFPKRHINQVIEIVKEFIKNWEGGIQIDYPKELEINPKISLEIVEEILIGRKERNAPKTDGIDTINIDFYKGTETKFIERIRKVLSKKKYKIPSMDVIKPSLDYLKERNIVTMRLQNNNQLWFLTPEFNTINRKLEREYNKTIHNSD